MVSENLKSEEHEEGNYQMRRVCSYCGKEMGYKDGGTTPGEVTHGVCEDCINRQIDELGENKEAA